MEQIKELLAITQTLRAEYIKYCDSDKINENRALFTLDGKLVGDIGELLVAKKYGLQLHHANNAHTHDATKGKKNIQIKASFLNQSYFPTNPKKVPQYFIAVQINNKGEIKELFNGPGNFIVKHYIKARGLKKNTRQYLYTLSGNVLLELNELVPKNQKI